jgi:uncharacterized protein YlxW (UPF0749 family)
MPDNTMDTNTKCLKSPVRKLARFFEQSRNRWKAKSKENKSNAKRFEKRIKYSKKRNVELKEKVKNLEYELDRVRVKEKQMEQSIMKKKL